MGWRLTFFFSFLKCRQQWEPHEPWKAPGGNCGMKYLNWRKSPLAKISSLQTLSQVFSFEPETCQSEGQSLMTERLGGCGSVGCSAVENETKCWRVNSGQLTPGQCVTGGDHSIKCLPLHTGILSTESSNLSYENKNVELQRILFCISTLFRHWGRKVEDWE